MLDAEKNPQNKTQNPQSPRPEQTESVKEEKKNPFTFPPNFSAAHCVPLLPSNSRGLLIAKQNRRAFVFSYPLEKKEASWDNEKI